MGKRTMPKLLRWSEYFPFSFFLRSGQKNRNEALPCTPTRELCKYCTECCAYTYVHERVCLPHTITRQKSRAKRGKQTPPPFPFSLSSYPRPNSIHPTDPHPTPHSSKCQFCRALFDKWTHSSRAPWEGVIEVRGPISSRTY